MKMETLKLMNSKKTDLDGLIKSSNCTAKKQQDKKGVSC